MSKNFFFDGIVEPYVISSGNELGKRIGSFVFRATHEGARRNEVPMIESLLEELPQNGTADETGDAPASQARASSEHSFLAALPIVRGIVGRRRSRLDSTNGSDLVQEVALRLWRWRGNYQEQSERMSGEEWKAFAARTAYNEVKRYFSDERNVANVPIDLASGIQEPSVEGQSEIEVISLINQAWQGICRLSLRQRWALLLHSQELIIYFLQVGITESDISDVLELSEPEWNEIRNEVPLTDAQIAKEMKFARRRATTASIKKARHEARVKLERSIRR